MKKLITLLVLLVACLSTMQATKIWPKTEGQTSTFNEWNLKDGDEDILLSPTDLATAKKGDRLVVSFTIIDATKWSAVNVWNKKSTTSYFDSGSVEGKTKTTITLDDAMIAAIKDTLNVTGCNIVVSEVDFEAGEIADAEGKIWPEKEGTTIDLGDWSGSLSLTADQYKGLAVGDKFVLKVTPAAGKETYAIELWSTGFGKNFAANSLKAEDTETTFVVDETMLAGITGGLVFSGCNETITEVDIVKSSKNADTVLWPKTAGKTTTFTGWTKTDGDGIEIAAADLTNVAVGDTLLVDYALVGTADDWQAIDIWNNDMTTAIYDQGVTFGTTSYAFIVNQAFVDAAAKGIAVTGSNITIKKITLKKKQSEGPSLSDNAIWPDAAGKSTTFTGWAKTAGEDIVLGADKFDKAAVGDKIIIKITPVGTADDYHEVDIFDSKWENAIADPMSFDLTTKELTITITEDLLAKLKSGCVITGSNVTVTEIDLTSPTGINTINANSQTTKVIYNISGQKVSNGRNLNELPQGIYIVNGKKYIVR